MRLNRLIASLLILGSLASVCPSARANENAGLLRSTSPYFTIEFRMDLPVFLDYLLPFCPEGPEEKVLRLNYA